MFRPILAAVFCSLVLIACRSPGSITPSDLKAFGDVYSVQSAQDDQGHDAIAIQLNQRDVGTVSCEFSTYPGSGMGASCVNDDFEFTQVPNQQQKTLLIVKATNDYIYMKCSGSARALSCTQSSVGQPLAVDPSMPKVRLQKVTNVLSVNFLDPMQDFAVVDSCPCTVTQRFDVTETICQAGCTRYSFARNSGSIMPVATITELNTGRKVKADCKPKSYYMVDIKVVMECLAIAP